MRKTVMLLTIMLMTIWLGGCINQPGERPPKGTTEANLGEAVGSHPGTGENPELSGNHQTGSGLNKEVIFRLEAIDSELPINMNTRLISGKNSVYICAKKAVVGQDMMDVTYRTILAGCRLDGTEMTVLYEGEKAVWQWTVDSEGNLVYLTEEATGQNTYRLCRVNRKGTVVEETVLTLDDQPETLGCVGEKLLLKVGTEILVYDQLDLPPVVIPCGEMGSIDGFYPAQDGACLVRYNPTPIPTLWELVSLDLTSGEWGETIEVSWKKTYASGVVAAGGGSGFDLIMWNGTGLSGWNVGEAEVTELVNFLDSDIDGSKIWGIAAVGERSFWITGENESGKVELNRLVQADPSQISEREVITLGCLIVGSDIRKEILRFNQESDQYRLRLEDYSVYGDQAENRLTLDMIGGDGPDLFLVDTYGQFPVKNYIQQGMLEDLWPWLEGDSELKREDFLVNVLEAYETDGALYEMPTAFRVDTCAVKSSVVGEKTSWTLDEAMALARKYPDSHLFPGRTTRDTVLQDMLQVNSFVDEQEGTCRFDSEEFLNLLEWVAEIPAEPDESISWPMQRTEEILLTSTGLSSFRNFHWTEHRTYGSEVTYIGYPSTEGHGGLITAKGTILAMSSQSDCKEGAWAFIRSFLTEEKQQEIALDNSVWFPVRTDVLEWLGEQELLKKNEDIDNYYYLDHQQIELPPLTKEEIDEAIRYLKTVNRRGSLNYDVYNIIVEESAPFFAGQKTAKQAAEIIQSRVGIYLAEQQ